MWPWERKAYTDAVNYLMSKPSRILTTEPSVAPGAKTRYALPYRNYANIGVLMCLKALMILLQFILTILLQSTLLFVTGKFYKTLTS
jgi:hypothetical protein